MKTKLKTIAFAISSAIAIMVFSQIYPRNGIHYDHDGPDNHYLLEIIQCSDLAGVATLLSITNGTIEVDVKQWWLGSLSTNRFEIDNIGFHMFEIYDPDYVHFHFSWLTPDKTGRDIVFFAVTNEWKHNSSRSPTEGLIYDWNYTQTFTNATDACPPIVMPYYNPPLFLVDTNSNYYVNVLSNITYSMFITRDKMQLYRGLRDAWGVDGKSEHPYRLMARFPLRHMIASNNEGFVESDYVEMLNDPLLFPSYRTNVLKRLIRDYNWSPTNSVPFP